jgi:hypothetical protein
MSSPKYIEIVAKVRAGTHRIISWSGRKYKNHNATKFSLQRLHPTLGWTCEGGVDLNVLRRASKELSYEYQVTYGIGVYS